MERLLWLEEGRAEGEDVAYRGHDYRLAVFCRVQTRELE